jgi:hypothetical protein
VNGRACGQRPVQRKRRTCIRKAKMVAPDAPQQERFGNAGAARIELVRVFGRLERLAKKIDQAFGGEPFLPDLAPDDPANLHRFYAFFNQHARVSRLLFRAIEAWMITCI